MSNPTEQKPKRNAGQRSQKSTQKPDGNERMGPAMAGADTVATSAHADLAPADTVAAPAKTISAAPANAISRPVNAVPAQAKAIPVAPAHAVSAPAKINLVSVNTFSSIAAAYSDYSKKSFEDTKCFVEKLAGVRSFDKAVEVQIEYAKAAYATFAAESQKIRQLYSDLAKQTFKPFVPKATRAAP
jgi:Phasin protein